MVVCLLIIYCDKIEVKMYIEENKKHFFVWCITSLVINSCLCAAPHQKIETKNSLMNGNGKYERLNNDIELFNYSIELTPYFPNENPEKAFTFDGYSQIVFRPTRNNVTEITLHMKDLSDITHILRSKSSRSSPSIKDTTYDNVTEQYTMFLTEPMNTRDVYTLFFGYVGILQTEKNGFYRQSYTENNATK